MAKARKVGKSKAASAKAAKTPKTKIEKPTAAVSVSTKPKAKTETSAPPAAATSRKLSFITIPSFRNWNKWLAVLHAVQGLAILVLSTAHTFPVTTTYLNLDPIASDLAGHPVLAAASKHLFEVNIALLVAAFFFISAIAHWVAATVYRRQYDVDLQRGINKVRWLECGLSASTMLVAIGLLSGIADLSTLIMIFALGLIMGLLGLAMEVYNQGKDHPNCLAYRIGALAGVVPWIVLALYAWGAGVYGSRVPTFVYWIYGSMLVFFAGFALNLYLQYKKKGKWADYLYGERVYMILSLAAKAALAWQIFVGTLRP